MDERTDKEADGNAGAEPVPDEFAVARVGEDGKPIYDREFFLALARCGKDMWNRWRAANPRVKGRRYIDVTFEGVDFRHPANAISISRGSSSAKTQTSAGASSGPAL